MLLKMLEAYKSQFSIIEIRSGEALEECFRTSFTWTELPKTLCLASNRKYYCQAIENKNIRGIVAPPSAIDGPGYDKALVISEKADELFYHLHNQKIHELKPGAADQAEPYISPTAKIASTAVVGKHVVIEDNVVIHDFCMVFDNSVIGSDSILHPYVIIGSQGFFSKMVLGKKTHIEHFGGVRIGRNCIVHTGTNIPRSVNIGEDTIIGENVHIGSHSSIGHDSKIGHNCDISAKVIISGRVNIGSNCWIGAGAMIANSLSIGENASLKIGAVVITNVPAGVSVSGNFATTHSKNLKEFLRRERGAE